MNRPLCEDFRRLSIRCIDFRPVAPAWQYPDGIAVSAARDYVRVVHGPADLRVEVEHTLCTYGGTRPWWLCPRCLRRCGIIYGLTSDGGFGCRKCLKLGYSSDVEDQFQRLDRKLRALHAKLGEVGKNIVGFERWTFIAERPKRMRLSTYWAIRGQITDARRDVVHYLTRRMR